jgi:hypothetical protein
MTLFEFLYGYFNSWEWGERRQQLKEAFKGILILVGLLLLILWNLVR